MTDETSGAIEARIIEAIRKRWSNVYDCHGEAVCEQACSDIDTLLAALAASEARVAALEAEKERGYPLEDVFTVIVRGYVEGKPYYESEFEDGIVQPFIDAGRVLALKDKIGNTYYAPASANRDAAALDGEPIAGLLTSG